MTKRIIYLTMGLFSLFGCGQKSNSTQTETVISSPKIILTQAETELIKKIDFNSELIDDVKDFTNKELKQLPAIDQETGDVLNNKCFNGIFSEMTEEKAREVVLKLKPKFREKGYLIFVFEGEDNKKNIAIIKGQNDLEILRYRRTDGINHGLENGDIVKKISEWKEKYGLVVVGCGRDWLEVEFDKLPADIDAFAKEVYKFCPDSVDQGVGTVENLRQAITEMKGVWLWWD